MFPTIDASANEQVEEFPPGVLGTSNGARGGSGDVPVGTGGNTLRFYTVGVGFTSYELDFFGRIRSLNHAALQQYFGFAETRRSVQLTLVAEVASAYLTILTDQTLLDITRETLKNQNDSYALTQRLFKAGSTTELALRQAESTVDTARANLAQLAAQQALVTASSVAYGLADTRFRGGVDSYLSALDAQRALYSAQQQLQTVRLLRLQNLVTLYKALGGGLLEHSSNSHPSPPAAR